ncbi:MAG TPA: hypothetical protein DFR83_15780 [Deltaproteobacteria bacterium]|nr:hypothetical protein [Deltaproteobacteria bacterium]
MCVSLGCAGPTVHRGPAPSSDLVTPLVGGWRIEGPTRSDCPAGVDRSLPRGETTWTDRAGRLHIASKTQTTPAVSLVPASDRHFTSQTEVAFPGCSGREVLTLEVAQLDRSWARGRYVAIFEHDGGPGCDRLLHEAHMTDRCETHMEWQARRL